MIIIMLWSKFRLDKHTLFINRMSTSKIHVLFVIYSLKDTFDKKNLKYSTEDYKLVGVAFFHKPQTCTKC